MVFDGGTTRDLIEDCPQDCLQVRFAAHLMAWMHDRPTEETLAQHLFTSFGLAQI